MGRKSIEIIGINVDELIHQLNSALAEEWLAFYQYWIGARVMVGPMRGDIEKELLLHATQELNHAVLVVGRIIQLGGTPILTPADWFKYARCKYDAPTDPYIERVLQQNLEGERCAIQRYQEIAQLTNGKDFATYQIATTILNEEIEHEEDIESWLADIQRLKEEVKQLRM